MHTNSNQKYFNFCLKISISRDKLKKLDTEKNLNGFIELANLVRSLSVFSLEKFRTKLYFAFFEFVNRPEILNDLKALKTANELHTKIAIETTCELGDSYPQKYSK